MADASLIESEELWKFAIAGSGAGVWDWDLQKGATRHSEGWKAIFGYTDPDSRFLNNEWIHYIHPEDRDGVLQSNLAFLKSTEEKFSKEFRFRCADQSYKWIKSRAIVVARNVEGVPLRLIGTHTDITQRKLAEIELEENNAEMVSLLNTTLDGYLKANLLGCITDVNPAYCRMSGYSRSELLGMHVSQLDCNATALHFAHRKAILERDGHDQFETLHRRRDGSLWTAEVSLTYRKGRSPALFGFFRNIEDRKKSQRALEKSEATLRATVNAIPDLMFEMDMAGIYYSFHSGDPDLLITSCEEHIGKKCVDILPADASSVIEAALKEAFECGHSFGRQYKLDLKNGIKWFELSLSRKEDENVSEPRFIGLSRDVTRRKQNELKVVESENQLRAIIEAEPACIKIVDATGNLIQMNSAGLQMVQADSMEQVLNTSVVSLIVPEHKQAFWDMHHRVLAGASMSLEFEIVGINGRRLWLESHAVPLQFNGANVQLAITHDITARKRNDTSLRIAAVAFESKEGMLIADANKVILRVNSAFVEMSGYSPEWVVGKTPQVLRPGLYDEVFYQKIWGELERTGAWQGEVLDRRKNGEIYPKRLSISVVRDSANQVTHYIECHNELSQRKRDEEALMKTNTELNQSRLELRQLAAQNEHKLEEERRHIAREVHDELGQSLTALRIGMTLLSKRYSKDNPTIVKDIQTLKVLVDRGIQGVRNVATNLRPAALDMGLVPAIQWLCSEFSEHNAIPCELMLNEENIDLDDARSVAIFRIVQEALTNISRYAHATRVGINLGIDGEKLGVEIRDDGCGFNVAISNSKSYGLIGMRERALALGGQIDFISRPGQGTVIGVSIPLGTKTEQMGTT